MNKKLCNTLLGLFLVCTGFGLQAEAQTLDRVVAVVNQDVILQSQLDTLVNKVQLDAAAAHQSLPDEAQLRKQALDRLISESLVLQLADRQGLRVSDTQLDQAIASIAAEQKMSVDQLRQEAHSKGLNEAQFRDEVRREMLMSEIRRNQVRQRINISDQEVQQVVKFMQSQGQKAQQYHVGHIMLALSADADADEQARVAAKAEQLIAELKKGADFRKMAIAESAGPKALEGGDWGWMTLEEMPTLLADAARDATPGDIVGPLRSGAGLHIVKVFETRGANASQQIEVRARHILLQPSIILTDAKAKQMLAGFLAEVKSGHADFAKLAEQYSEDPGSAVQGGELGWADPNIYDPQFRDVLMKLEPGQYSAPFRSSHGWHIVQLEERRQQQATDENMKNRAYQMIYNRRFAEEVQVWLDELRDEAYINIINGQAN
ncbi:peptidylprolyl isomerase SurA [Pseudaeromonas sharmana]|uniref:Chaperone SurA n=1 Tax=Pseudaeromonas sharmana TaxID=328412 RepID=A0ABV8CM62_9GAMM